jgi:1-aminocyclopropane-1-carboxylate deaminase
MNNKKSFSLIHDYHFGGYAKYTAELLEFMNDFYRVTQIPSDFVYTGKLFFAVKDRIEKKYFPAGVKILVIHSGGLQGNSSLPKGTLIF